MLAHEIPLLDEGPECAPELFGSGGRRRDGSPEESRPGVPQRGPPGGHYEPPAAVCRLKGGARLAEGAWARSAGRVDELGDVIRRAGRLEAPLLNLRGVLQALRSLLARGGKKLFDNLGPAGRGTVLCASTRRREGRARMSRRQHLCRHCRT